MSVKDSGSVIIRTSPYAGELVKNLLPHSKTRKVLSRRRMSLVVSDVQYCYLILSGRVTVHRQHDDLTIATVSSPSLVGIGNTLNYIMTGYIKTLSPCEIGVITTDQAYNVIEDKNLWEVLSKHMLIVSGKLYTYSTQLTAPSSYEVICIQLHELMNEDESIRLNMTAENYIRDKTNLSRSGIMRIISGLKSGGYIETQKGILLKINMLPKKW